MVDPKEKFEEGEFRDILYSVLVLLSIGDSCAFNGAAGWRMKKWEALGLDLNDIFTRRRVLIWIQRLRSHMRRQHWKVIGIENEKLTTLDRVPGI